MRDIRQIIKQSIKFTKSTNEITELSKDFTKFTNKITKWSIKNFRSIKSDFWTWGKIENSKWKKFENGKGWIKWKLIKTD